MTVTKTSHSLELGCAVPNSVKTCVPSWFFPAIMPPVQFKFALKEGTARIAAFKDHPSWRELAERIHRIYSIPLADVGISYKDT